jgi:hypothetical protein
VTLSASTASKPIASARANSATTSMRLLAAPKPAECVIEPENADDQTERRRHSDGLAWLHHEHGYSDDNEQAGA